MGIVAAAYALPTGRMSGLEVFEREGVAYTPEIAERLGIESVPMCSDETGSGMALAASQEALRKAAIDAAQIDVILDFTILPQEYLVPAWNMSNKLQHELGAKKAFTVGFSGGAASNFLVALVSATTLLATDDKLKTALLVAADIAIAGNRILNPADPVSLLGDGASAIILQKGAGREVVDYSLVTDGANHDIYFIPGGALANHDPQAYRLQFDNTRFKAARDSSPLGSMVSGMMGRAGLQTRQLSAALLPNLSAQDQLKLQQQLGLHSEQVNTSNRKKYGHLQGNDFVLNYLAATEDSAVKPGSYMLLASHGMGFMPAAALVQC